MRCYVIGDIHGCLDELRYLLEGLPLNPAIGWFLGRLCRPGPNSKGVLDYMLELQKRDDLEVICLKGNHEDMFLAYLGLPGQHGNMFLYNGVTLLCSVMESSQNSLR
jgi:serine/threonine protein phosphatase 1